MKTPNVWQVCHHCRGEWACGWCSGGDAIECACCNEQVDTRGMGDLELNALARTYEARGVRCEECAKAEFVTADTLPPFGSTLEVPEDPFSVAYAAAQESQAAELVHEEGFST